jgi:hypothetical protein
LAGDFPGIMRSVSQCLDMMRQIRFRIEFHYLNTSNTRNKALEAAAMHDDGGASCATRFDQLALAHQQLSQAFYLKKK